MFQNPLIRRYIQVFCIFVSTFFGLFLSISKVSAAPLKYGSSFNLMHKSTGRYLSYVDMHFFAFPGDPNNRFLTVTNTTEKNFLSRCTIMNPTNLPDEVPDKSAIILKFIDPDCGLTKEFGGGFRGVHNWGTGPMHLVTFHKINDYTFALSNGVDSLINLKSPTTGFGLVNNPAAFANPENFPEFHFQAVDVDVDFGQNIITQIRETASKMQEKGFKYAGGTIAPDNVDPYINGDSELRRISIALDEAGKPQFFGIRTKDNRVVMLDQAANIFRPISHLTNISNTPAYADSISASDVSTTSPAGRLLVNDRRNLVPWTSIQKTFEFGWKGIVPDLGITAAPEWISSRWGAGNIATTVTAVNGQYTLFILDNLSLQMSLQVGAAAPKIVETPFPVLDACLGTDGTIWCVSTGGFIHRIDAGTFSYQNSGKTTRDLLGRKTKSAGPWNLAEELQAPANIAVRAAGNATDNIVAVLNSVGEVYISKNNGEFVNLGVSGIIDLSVAQDGTIALISQLRSNNFSGIVWTGNISGANAQEIANMVVAKNAAKAAGGYTGGFLDVPVIISQIVNSTKKYITQSTTDDSLLVSNTSQNNAVYSFALTPRGENAYSIIYNEKNLVVRKTGDTYNILLSDGVESGDSDIFYVYGTPDKARIRNQDFYLAANADGTVSLSKTETFLLFENADAILAAAGVQNLNELNALKLKLQQATQAAIDKVAAETAALQAKLIAEKIESEKTALQAQITTLQENQTQLRSQISAANALKTEMQAKLDAIEADRLAQEKVIADKIAALELQLAQETDAVKKLEIQNQIDALKSSKDDLAAVLMQNAKVIADQAKQQIALAKQKTDLQNEILNINQDAERKAQMAKQAFSGDISTMIATILLNTRTKLASVFELQPEGLNTIFVFGEPFAYQTLEALATKAGKTKDALAASIKKIYLKDEADALKAISDDVAIITSLQAITVDAIVSGFKEDLVRFAAATGLEMGNLVEQLAGGFSKIINGEKIKQLEALLAAETNDVNKNEILKELTLLDPARTGAQATTADAAAIAEIRQKIDVLNKKVESEFDQKINASFTQTAQNLGSAWSVSKDMVARIVNYDVLQAKYKAELVELEKQRDALKVKLTASINTNEQLRAKLRTFMDERAAQQKEIDDSITSLRRQLVSATSAADMQVFVQQVKALKSSNDEILKQLKENDIKILENEAVLMKQDTTIKILEKSAEEIKAQQTLFMQTAVEQKSALKESITTALANYTLADVPYKAELEKINAIVPSTAEGIADKANQITTLQGTYFAKKKSDMDKIQNLTTQFIAEVEKLKSALTEQIAELEGKKRTETQNYDKQLADLALSDKANDPVALSTIKTNYQNTIKPFDDKILEIKKTIDSKEADIADVQKDNAKHLLALNDMIREASASQIEQLRYQMLTQNDEEKKASQERITRIQEDNKKMLDDINAVYEETKRKLQENADLVKKANQERTDQLNKTLADNKAMFEKHQNELNSMIDAMVAKGTMAAEQKKLFLEWKDRIAKALQAKVNELNSIYANFKSDIDDDPENFDKNLEVELENLRSLLPKLPELLEVIGLKNPETSVQEEFITKNIITDLKTRVNSLNVGSGEVFVFGIVDDADVEKIAGYLQKDATEAIVLNNINILKNVSIKMVNRGSNNVSIEIPSYDKQNTMLRLTATGDGKTLSFEKEINTEVDGAIAPDATQVFSIEYSDKGAFVLSNNGQYLSLNGKITTSSTAESARLILSSKDNAKKFTAFNTPSADIETYFKILEDQLPTQLKTFKSNNTPEEFKRIIGSFKLALSSGFDVIETIKNGFLTQITKINTDLKDRDLVAIQAKLTAEEGKIDEKTKAEIKDLETDKTLSEALASSTNLEEQTKTSIRELILESQRQAEISGRTLKEQLYRIKELRKTYLETTVEKNSQIGFLEADSRWEKYQWARDIYLLIQLQLDASERDKLEFDKELQATQDKFAAKKNDLIAERDKTVQNLKETLEKKIADAKRTSDELQTLNAEKEKIFQDHMAQIQKDWEALSSEEQLERKKRMDILNEENAALMKGINEKYAHKLEMIELDKKRMETLSSAQLSSLERQILNAEQYLVSFKIDSGSEIAISTKSSTNNQVNYINQGQFDNLQVGPAIRFDKNTRFKIVSQDLGSYSIETLDGKKRIALINNGADVDLLDAVDVQSPVKGEENKQVASPEQTFFVEGSQANGVVLRDRNKIGYLTIKEVPSDPKNPQSKKINIIVFTTTKEALAGQAEGSDMVTETRFNIIPFAKGSIDDLLNTFYANQDRKQSEQAITSAEEFFNKNKIYNYPALMENFIQSVTEFGQGRVSTGLMTEDAIEKTNKFLSQINETFNFSVSQEGQVVAGGKIRLVDQDYVEPILLEEGQSIVISYIGKYLAQNELLDQGSIKINFVNGNIFDKNLNLKVIPSGKQNTVALANMTGTKRLSLQNGNLRWVDAVDSIKESELFTFSGTRNQASISTDNYALTAFQTPLLDQSGNPVIDDKGLPKGTGQISLKAIPQSEQATAFKVDIFEKNSFEAMLVSQGIESYKDNAESKNAIENITSKLIGLLEGSAFDDDDKNSFINSFATYLEAYVSPESIAMWANSVKRVGFTAKQNMKEIDQAIMGRLSNVVQEFNVPSGAYLILKHQQEGKYLAVDANHKIVAKQSSQISADMLFKVLKQGDKFALVTQDGQGGYLTEDDSGIIEGRDLQVMAGETVKIKPNEKQLFWLIGYGNQLTIKLGTTNIADPEGFLAVHANLGLTSWNYDNPDQRPKYKSTSSRVRFDAQVLDENSLLRGIINQGKSSVTRILLEGLMATREDKKLKDEQKSLVAQQKLKEFEEFILQKEVRPAVKEGGEPVILYTLKPEFEELRGIQTSEKDEIYSLKDTISYIEKYVLYDPMAKAGIKLGKVGETIFRAMREAFSQFRLLEKNINDEKLNSIINPGNLEVKLDEFGNPMSDYIGTYLDSLAGGEADPVKTAPILYAYTLNLAKTLYSPGYRDNSIRFKINNKGQLVDKKGVTYSMDAFGKFKSQTGVEFTEFADPITDPDGNLIAESEQFDPGITISVTAKTGPVSITIPAQANKAANDKMKADIKDNKQLSAAEKQGLLNALDKLEASGATDTASIQRVIEGTKFVVTMNLTPKNKKQKLTIDPQISVEFKTKINNALNKFIDGNSLIITRISNAKDLLSEIQGATTIPPFSELKDTLVKNFKSNKNLKADDLKSMIRMISVRSAFETPSWRRDMLVELLSFIGTQATFEKLEDGSFQLKADAGKSQVIYDGQDMKDLIEKIRQQLLQVTLREGQTAITDKYDGLLDQALELYFISKFKEAAQILKSFTDDNMPKDWAKADVPATWFNGVRPLPGDGSPSAIEKNEYDRKRAWNDEKPVLLIRLLTQEQQMIRLNLLDYVNADLLKASRSAALANSRLQATKK